MNCTGAGSRAAATGDRRPGAEHGTSVCSDIPRFRRNNNGNVAIAGTSRTRTGNKPAPCE